MYITFKNKCENSIKEHDSYKHFKFGVCEIRFIVNRDEEETTYY